MRKKKDNLFRRCVLHASRGDENVAGRHSHHLAPLEYGGAKDGEQVNLCSSCHDEFHRLANFVYIGKMDMSDINNVVLAKMLAIYLRQRSAYENGAVSADDARRRIQVGFSREELLAAHFVKSDMGFSSLEKMIKSLVLKEYERLRKGL